MVDRDTSIGAEAASRTPLVVMAAGLFSLSCLILIWQGVLSGDESQGRIPTLVWSGPVYVSQKALKPAEVHRLSLPAVETPVRLRIAGQQIRLELQGPESSGLPPLRCCPGLEPLELVIAPRDLATREIIVTAQNASGMGSFFRIEAWQATRALAPAVVAAENSFRQAEHLASRWNQRDQQLAAKAFQAGLRNLVVTSDPQRQAQVLRRQGSVLVELGDDAQALKVFREALKRSEIALDEMGKLSSRLAICEIEARREHHPSLEYTCLDNLGRSRLQADPRWLVRALIISGDLHYFRGRLEEGLRSYKRAAAEATRANDDRGLALAQLYAGFSLIDMSRHSAGNDSLNSALKTFRDLRDRRGEAQVLTAIGHFHSKLGRRQLALDYYESARRLYSESGYLDQQAELLSGLGYVYFESGDYSTALNYYRRSLRVFESRQHDNGRANVLMSIGRILIAQGKTAEARRALQESSEIFVQLNDRRMSAYPLTYLGEIHSSKQEWPQAREAFEAALAIKREFDDRYDIARTLNQIGLTHLYQANFRLAQSLFEQALDLSREERQGAGDPVGEAIASANLAKVARELGDLYLAESRISAALEIVEGLRSRIASPELRAFSFMKLRELYDFQIDLQMLAHSRGIAGALEAAFETSERARARTLIESLAESSTETGQIPLDLVATEEDLRSQLNKFHLELGTVKSSDLRRQIEDWIAQLEIEHREIRGQVYRHKAFSSAAEDHSEPLNLAAIRDRVVDEHHILLEYALGEESSYLWAVSEGKHAGFRLPARRDIEHQVENLLDEVSRPKRSASSPYLDQVSRAVSLALLSPVYDLLPGKSLIVVPDGALAHLPFGMLPIPDPEPVDGIEVEWVPLISEHELTVSPSASVLASLMDREADRGASEMNRLLILADPVYGLDDPRVIPNAENRRTTSARQHTALQHLARDIGWDQSRVPRLISTGLEARSILRVVPEEGSSVLRLGFEANRQTMFATDFSRFDVVHVASHGILNEQHPGLSGILLSLYDREGSPQDGYLRLHDIYALQCPAALVVLSSCKSALGREIRGEGVMGLVRGFFNAGASRVIASRWRVDDRATAELMRRFYTYLFRERQRPAAALRSAQIELWRSNRWAHPFYWSAFMLHGIPDLGASGAAGPPPNRH